jgi:hypothetical protein
MKMDFANQHLPGKKALVPSLISKLNVPDVIRYIQNQAAHHKKEAFLDEYKKMLKAFEVEYDERYIFKEPE